MNHSRILFDSGSELRVRQYVECLKLLRRDALQIEDLGYCARKAALGQLGVALHEENDGGALYCILDLLAGVLGEETTGGGCETAEGERAG